MLNAGSRDLRGWRQIAGRAAWFPAFAGGLLFATPAAFAETRTFVVSWFTQAVYSEETDCAGGTNPVIAEQWVKDLRDAGKTAAEIEDIIGHNKNDQLINRATIGGKAVNAYANPQAIKDPNLTKATGKYGFGFNLDGKGAQSPDGFEDPFTHEKGLNNQAARALGCFHAFRATYPERSSNWELWWGLASDSMPAWLITIEGADLSKDGDVNVVLERSLDHKLRDAKSETRADVTFRVDPSPRSRNTMRGRIQNGVLTTEPADVHMVGDALVISQLEMRKARLRLALKPDGTIDGIIGGYEPWKEIYFGMGGGNGFGYESNIGADVPGAYHLLRKLADADPDPATGQNRLISAAWRIEGVRAYAAPAEPPQGRRTAAEGNR